MAFVHHLLDMTQQAVCSSSTCKTATDKLSINSTDHSAERSADRKLPAQHRNKGIPSKGEEGLYLQPFGPGIGSGQWSTVRATSW